MSDKEITTVATNKAMAYCSRSEKCVFEVKHYLARYQLPFASVEKIIEELENHGFIDNQRYCSAFVNDKIRLAKWGKLKVRYSLLAKQLPDNLIERALNEFPLSDYKSIVHEAIEGKWKTLGNGDFNTRKAKVLRFAQSRGYEAELCYSFLESIQG